MSLASIYRAFVDALRTEGATGAPWGTRVYTQTTSSVLELSSKPREQSWPCLILTGPEVTEDLRLRADVARERLSEDRTAGEMTVRAWPRRFDLRVAVAFQTRVGSTGSVTLMESELAGIERFLAWLRRTPTVSDAAVSGVPAEDRQTVDLQQVAALGDGGRRPTPADLREARGAVVLRAVRLWSSGPVTVPTAREILTIAGLDTSG